MEEKNYKPVNTNKVGENKSPFKGALGWLDNRVKTMNNDIIKIDQLISEEFGLPVEVDRVARADGKKDARKD